MLKKTITYTDYEDNERTEDFYFNLTTAEIAKMGISNEAETLNANDVSALTKFYEKIILGAYGVKSADGKYFRKSEELASDFASCPAYDVLFRELTSDEANVEEFLKGIVPKNFAEKLTRKN